MDPSQMPPNQPPAPQVPEKKKGIPVLGWVGIGCGVFLVIGIIAVVMLVGFFKKAYDDFEAEFSKDPNKAAAEMFVSMNPDIDMVASNEETGEITIKVKETGEEITVNYGDLASGKFSVKKSDGSEITIGKLDESKVPTWVARYPNVIGEPAGYHQDKATGSNGMLVFQTSDTPSMVEAFYEGEFGSLGAHTHSNMTINGMTSLEHSFSGGGREVKLHITSGQSDAGTSVQIIYEEK